MMLLNARQIDDYIGESWSAENSAVVNSYFEAFLSMLSPELTLTATRIILGTDNQSVALGLTEKSDRVTRHRNEAITALAEIPVNFRTNTDLTFSFVLISLNNHSYKSLYTPFVEAHRLLRDNGSLIIGFIDSHSAFQRSTQGQIDRIAFPAASYSAHKILFELSEAGFRQVEIVQTLFPEPTQTLRSVKLKPGFGEGAFVVIKAVKKKILKRTS